MSVINVSLQVPLGKISSTASVMPIAGSTVSTHKELGQACLFHSLDALFTARAGFTLFLTTTSQAIDVLTRNLNLKMKKLKIWQELKYKSSVLTRRP